MAIKDFLDNVTYPNMERRTDILLNYFNTSDLHLSIDSYLKLNNLSKEIKADFFDSNGLFYTVNKDLREKIRRFNNHLFFFTVSYTVKHIRIKMRRAPLGTRLVLYCC